MKSEGEIKKRTEYWKELRAGIIDKSAEFDCETCPFCNCVLDLQKDFDSDLSLSSAICLFKCHACGYCICSCAACRFLAGSRAQQV